MSVEAVMDCIGNPLKARVMLLMREFGPMTPKQILQEDPRIPPASLYRALKSMEKAEVIEMVAETKVRAVVEKSYALNDDLRGRVDQMVRNNDGEVYFKLFMGFAFNLMRTFENYSRREGVDLKNDGSGFFAVPVYATKEELEDMYPDLTPKQREDAITREKRAVFIEKIGGLLKSGQRHDGRAPDYDDWELNGDIILWNDVLDRSFEISSMGIRVDEEAMDRQLKEAGADDRRDMEFHRMILERKLPYTIGGGIGQSRLCMYFLRKAHIGEVQASIWPEEMVRECRENDIFLL